METAGGGGNQSLLHLRVAEANVPCGAWSINATVTTYAAAVTLGACSSIPGALWNATRPVCNVDGSISLSFYERAVRPPRCYACTKASTAATPATAAAIALSSQCVHDGRRVAACQDCWGNPLDVNGLLSRQYLDYALVPPELSDFDLLGANYADSGESAREALSLVANRWLILVQNRSLQMTTAFPLPSSRLTNGTCADALRVEVSGAAMGTPLVRLSFVPQEVFCLHSSYLSCADPRLSHSVPRYRWTSAR